MIRTFPPRGRKQDTRSKRNCGTDCAARVAAADVAPVHAHRLEVRVPVDARDETVLVTRAAADSPALLVQVLAGLFETEAFEEESLLQRQAVLLLELVRRLVAVLQVGLLAVAAPDCVQLGSRADGGDDRAQVVRVSPDAALLAERLVAPVRGHPGRHHDQTIESELALRQDREDLLRLEIDARVLRVPADDALDLRIGVHARWHVGRRAVEQCRDHSPAVLRIGAQTVEVVGRDARLREHLQGRLELLASHLS